MLIQNKHFNIVNFASTDATRYQLTSVHAKSKDGKGELCSTNGKILAILSFNSQDEKEAIEGTLQDTSIKNWIKLTPTKEKESYSELGIKSDKASLVCNGRKQDVELIDGIFPNYKSVLPADNKTASIKFNPFIFKKALDGFIKTLGIKDKDEVNIDLTYSIKADNSLDPSKPIMISNTKEHDGAIMKALIMPLVVKK